MHRTTIMLPAELKNRAARYCEQKGISLGGLIREALAREIRQAGETGSGQDTFFADKEIYKKGAPDDLSRNHDEYLYGNRQ